MARKLVTVRRVGAIKPIINADKIEVAVVEGWSCVVEKGQFKPGRLGLFFEIDCFLPGTDTRWAFLEPNFIEWNGQKGFRVKSQMIRKQISQGLLVSLDDFPEVLAGLVELEMKHGRKKAADAILDMAFEDMLNVQKWEPLHSAKPGQAAEKVGEAFPSFIQKTDQERCQNLSNVFDKYKDEIFQETTKMDGSSMTVYFVRNDSDNFQRLPELNADRNPTAHAVLSKGRIGICSRNLDLYENENCQFWDVAKKLDLPEKLSKLNRDIAIQGELCGSSIQGNFEGFPKGVHEFFVFSIWDIEEQKYLRPKETEQMAKQLGFKHVKVHGYHRLGDIATNVEELLRRAEGTGLYRKKREGIVLKHVNGEFSFKAISNSYLIKHGE